MVREAEMTTNKNTIPQLTPIKPHIRPWTFSYHDATETRYWICEEPKSILTGMKYCIGNTPRDAYEKYFEEYLSEQ